MQTYAIALSTLKKQVVLQEKKNRETVYNELSSKINT